MLKFAASYMTFLSANTLAFDSGEDEFCVELVGKEFEQPTFKYQVKCFKRLRLLFEANDRPSLRELLSQTGCLTYLFGKLKKVRQRRPCSATPNRFWHFPCELD